MTNDQARGAAPAAARDMESDRSSEEPFLGSLSALASHGFASAGDAADEILRLLTALLGTRTGYVARIDAAEGTSTIVAAHDETGGCGVVPGVRHDLRNTF